MNNDFQNQLVNLLTKKDTTKLDIAQLLLQNDIEITDDQLSDISSSIFEDDDIENTTYELSADKTSFAVIASSEMSKELKKSFIRIPTKEEARFLQDIYYQTQAKRLAIGNQLRSIKKKMDSQSVDKSKNETNTMFLEWYLNETLKMEENIKKALEAFSDSYYISRWAKKNVGIGPVIATVLAANLDILSKDMHHTNWLSYCGLNDNNRPWLGKEKSKNIVNQCIKENNDVLDDETVYKIAALTKWKYSFLESKAKKNGKWNKTDLIKACSLIPYNKRLKVLAFKIGHSFRMCMNKPDSLYGRILRQREEYENTRNAAGDYKDQAEAALANKDYGKNTISYQYYIKGMLPPTHIHQRCERYAAKMFISHCFEAMWYNKYGEECPPTYILASDENPHTDYIPPEVPYDSVARD